MNLMNLGSYLGHQKRILEARKDLFMETRKRPSTRDFEIQRLAGSKIPQRHSVIKLTIEDNRHANEKIQV